MGGSVGGRDLDFGVATWKSHCGQKRCRDMKLMSRHRVVSRRSRPRNEVTTWLVVVRLERRSRHGIDIATWPVGN